MPRLAQHEACEGTNGGVFFGHENITPFAIRSVYEGIPTEKTVFLGIFQVFW